MPLNILPKKHGAGTGQRTMVFALFLSAKRAAAHYCRRRKYWNKGKNKTPGWARRRELLAKMQGG